MVQGEIMEMNHEFPLTALGFVAWCCSRWLAAHEPLSQPQGDRPAAVPVRSPGSAGSHREAPVRSQEPGAARELRQAGAVRRRSCVAPLQDSCTGEKNGTAARLVGLGV